MNITATTPAADYVAAREDLVALSSATEAIVNAYATTYADRFMGDLPEAIVAAWNAAHDAATAVAADIAALDRAWNYRNTEGHYGTAQD